jgi:hypothetical protein
MGRFAISNNSASEVAAGKVWTSSLPSPNTWMERSAPDFGASNGGRLAKVGYALFVRVDMFGWIRNRCPDATIRTI